MTEEILPNLYQIKVPLPQSPLKALNSYVIKGKERNLIVDTGFNREECASAMFAGLKELDIDLHKTDFFITHLHSDHLGLVSRLKTATSTIYFSQVDAAVVNSDNHWKWDSVFIEKNGLSTEERQRALENHPGRRYGPEDGLIFHVMSEGDMVVAGNYSFKCIATPGHTRGHMCLYESSKKILLAGDHILIDITPNISLWAEDCSPLDEYMDSLDKVYRLDVQLVLPGHRSIFKDCKKRIKELKQHHETRANEVLAILKDGALNTYQIASRMTWDMDYKSWEQFPAPQKWFAFGEAMAHLKYLEDKGKVAKDEQPQKTVYYLKK
jgi:glyoxylase-like metal-dependent hydrolase (beta-lactamase superfamily II)